MSINWKELAKLVPEDIRIQMMYHLDQIEFNLARRNSGVDTEFLAVENQKQINAIKDLFALPADWSNSASPKVRDLEAQKNSAEITGLDAEGEKIEQPA